MRAQRRNLEAMGDRENNRRQEGAWTPFVGVALAIVTSGSLILFSLVAQRTSLDGFSSRGVTAISPSSSTPRSITLPAGAAGSGSTTSSESPTSPIDDVLSTLSPAGSTSTDVAIAPQPTTNTIDATSDDAGDVAAASRERRADDDGFTTGPADGDDAPAPYRNGRDRAAGQDREAADDDNGKRASDDRSHRKNKYEAKGKSKAKRRGRDGRVKDPSARRDGPHGHPSRDRDRGHGRNKGHGHKGRSHSSASRGGSHPSSPAPRSVPARPKHSSQPAARPRPQPQQVSKPKSKGAPPGHSNSNSHGKKHSKNRGRG